MKKLLIGSAVLILAACASTTKQGTVNVTRQQFMTVSAATVEQMSFVNYVQQNENAQSAGKLITQGREYDRIRRIAGRLINQALVFRDDTGSWKWQLVLIDEPILNATCGSGGKITFYTGLVRQLYLTDDEIAMVMGHEIAHALREHAREKASQAYAQKFISTTAVAAAPDKQAQIQLANQFANYLLILPYSRVMESEADKIGLELAGRAGFNPNASITLWQKMSNLGNGRQTPEFLSTHPSNISRITELASMLPAVMPLYINARQY